ncbi:hypothetical protein D0Y53_05995 [Luteimonas weifangensis]|uniref:Uncharacterized protein n=1 Tax=Cognatiluteimonas weifangensis TaxID=2303539 RepID=A0A372DNZ5_9GAMM|nr:hypothetical protein D0Y53_05995 [Luteimonas weifangensis]
MEAGGPACAGPSAAWMPPRSLQGRIHGVSRTGRAAGFPSQKLPRLKGGFTTHPVEAGPPASPQRFPHKKSVEMHACDTRAGERPGQGRSAGDMDVAARPTWMCLWRVLPWPGFLRAGSAGTR